MKIILILAMLLLLFVTQASASIEYGEGWRKACDDTGKCSYSNYHTIQRWDGQYIPYESLNITTEQWTYQKLENTTHYNLRVLTEQGSEWLSLPINFGNYTFGLNKVSFEFTVTPAQLNLKSVTNGTGQWYIPIPDKAVKTKFLWDNKKPFVYRNNNQSDYLNITEYWYSTVNDQIRLNYNQTARSFGIASTNVTFVFDSWTVGSGGSAWSGNSSFNNVTKDIGNTNIVIGSFSHNVVSGNDLSSWTSVSGTWDITGTPGYIRDTSVSTQTMLHNGIVSTNETYILANISVDFDAGVWFYIQSSLPNDNTYLVGIRSENYADDVTQLELYKRVGGTFTSLGTATSNPVITRNQYYTYLIHINSSNGINVYQDNTLYISKTDTTYTSGRTGFRSSGGYDNRYQLLRTYSNLSGDLTTWHDAGSGNETYQLNVNFSSIPTNTNYTAYYRQNATGDYVQIGTANHNANQSISLTTKYQNTDVRVQLFGSTNATPELMSITFNTQVAEGGAGDFIPPSPINLTNTTNSITRYINFTWSAGSGNITNSYNVSVNGTWTNGSSNAFSNATTTAHGWRNISVYAFNNSGNGTLNSTPATMNTQLPNAVPVMDSIGDKSVNENTLLSFTITGTDSDNDGLTCSKNESSKGSLAGCDFTYTPNYSESGTYQVNFTIDDGYGGTDFELITITVTNIPLTITSKTPATDPTNTVGELRNFNITVNRSYNATWYINGTVVSYAQNYSNTSASIGYWNVTVVVNDTGVSSDIDSEMWNWTVNAVTTYIPPTPINLTNTEGNFWVNWTWEAGAGNITNSYNVSVNGTWTNGTTSPFINTTLSPHGWANISVYAFNNTGGLNSTPVTDIEQVDNNALSQSAIGNKTVQEGNWLNFSVIVTDLDGDTITYGSNNSKGTLSSNNFNWSTEEGDSGTYVWYFSSSDGNGSTGNETITVTVLDSTPILISHIPDITSNNLILTPLNITYQLSANYSDVNVSTINIYFNTTLNGSIVNSFINGTLVQPNYGNFSETSNNSVNTSFVFQDELVYPTTKAMVDEPPHEACSIGCHTGADYNTVTNPTNNKNIFKSRFYNISDLKPYNIFEVMTNVTTVAGQSPMNVFYCNSSYASGTDIYSSPNCGQIGSLTPTINFSHVDLVMEAGTYGENVIEFAVNLTSKEIAGVKITNDSYFALQPLSSGWNIYYTNNITREDQSQRSTDRKSFNNWSGTFRMSVHQIDGDHFNYSVCYNSTSSGKRFCSVVSSDNIIAADVPPIGAQFTNPDGNNTFVNNTNFTIMWDAGYSLTDDYITNYNLTLWRSGTFIKSIGNFSNTTLSYSWNPGEAGIGIDYNFRMNTTSNKSLTTLTTSAPFNITSDSIPPVPVIDTIVIGNFFKNMSWTAGSGNITDGYNVSRNGTWFNGTTLFLNTSTTPHGWINDSVYAWNSSSGLLSTTALTNNSQIPNNAINISGISDTYNINAGNTLNIDADYSDADSDIGIFARNFSTGTFNTTTGVLSWVTGVGDVGTYYWQINVSDGYGSIATKDFTVTVSESGGTGTNWDWATFNVKYTNGTNINTALVATSVGNFYTDALGTVDTGYVFEDSLTYWINVSKSGLQSNNTQLLFNEDHETYTIYLAENVTNPLPNITSWSNDNTSNSTITLSVPKNTNITFNVTINQSVTTTWIGTASPTKINGTDSTTSYAFKNFTSAGTFTVIASCSNANGSCLNSITWTVTVPGTVNITLNGYVDNSLGVFLENARVDFNGGYDLTNANGYYEFTGADEGTYTVLARAVGYRNSTNTSTISSNTTMNFTLSERTSGSISTPGFEWFLLVLAVMVLYAKRRR